MVYSVLYIGTLYWLENYWKQFVEQVWDSAGGTGCKQEQGKARRATKANLPQAAINPYSE